VCFTYYITDFSKSGKEIILVKKSHHASLEGL
jgi:hypothetical protein